ncbi:MAG: single-stranded DNA-binding protein [Clostridia bacterium]|nr:single-stranded DNA-binding protein [Clostridia bacterium]
MEAPVLKTTPNGVNVTGFRVAASCRSYKDDIFITVVAWRGLAENVCKFVTKGQQLGITGEIVTRSYEAREGGRRWITEIVADEIQFLAKPHPAASPEMFEGVEILEEDGELPF